MDDKLNILLNSEKNINSVNVDTFTKLSLENKTSKFNEYNVRNVLSVIELFELEREKNQIYRIYGGFEYVSLLDGVRNNYNSLNDFFIPQITGDTKTIFNSFDFYLVRPSDEEYTNISGLQPVADEDTVTTVLDENFDNWSGGVPVGWNHTPGVGGNIEQAPGNRLRVNLGDNTFINIVVMNRQLSPLSGNITIETSVNITPDLASNDLMTLSFEYLDENNNAVFLDTRNLLANGVGEQTYNIFIPLNTPATRISLWCNSRNKSMFMDYLKITTTSSGDVLYGLNNPPLNFPSTVHRRTFKVLTKLNNFELFNAGFSRNAYDDRKYIYSFNVDFDVSEFLDGFGMPLTDLYLYAQYKPTLNEVLTFESWNNAGEFSEIPYIPQQFNVGDTIKSSLNELICDLVEFSRPKFYQRQDTLQTFRISTPIASTFSGTIKWRYNPFIPIKLRYFEDYLNIVNRNTDSYEDLETIPEYAFELNNEDMVWKNIMPEGYIDPLTGIGTNHPFVNKKRYLFENIVFEIYPDLNDFSTRLAFSSIWFERNIIPISTLPVTNINDINKPC